MKNRGGTPDDRNFNGGKGIENTLVVVGVTILTSGKRESFKIDGGMRDEK